jgi:hypothetical protein
MLILEYWGIIANAPFPDNPYRILSRRIHPGSQYRKSSRDSIGIDLLEEKVECPCRWMGKVFGESL